MFEFTEQEALLIGAVIAFHSPVFQFLRYLAAQPIIAKVIGWIGERLQWLPGSGAFWSRVYLYALAAGFLYLRGINVFSLPPMPFEATIDYVTALFTWATNMVMNAGGLLTSMHFVYHYLYKKLYQSDLPLVKELDSNKIAATAAKNS